MTGASASLTVTVNPQVPALPDPSVAVHVTVVVPFPNEVPDGGAQTGVTASQLSVAAAEKVATDEH